jgi:uncharacterized membrane protein (DUF485 family)
MAHVAERSGDPAAPGSAGSVTAGAEHHPEIDWAAAESSPEFKELTRRRRSFVIPALGFVFFWYFGFIALAGYAPDFMGESIYQGFTVGYLLALSQFVMTWVLAWLYLRRADRVFDPLSQAAAERALRESGGVDVAGDGHAIRPTDGDGAAARKKRTEEVTR